MERTIAARSVATLIGDFDREPAYRGLAEALRVLVTDGRIPTGVRLPSERDLTQALGVSRTTVTRAYAELRDRGFLVSRQGSGSVTTLPGRQSLRSDRLLIPHADTENLDLTCAAPVPGPGVLGAYERAVTRLPDYLCGSGYFPSGLPELRTMIADHYTAEGLPTTAEQILVVPGAQSGVSIAASALIGRGDRVLVESPTYPNGISALRRAGGRLVSSHVSRSAPDVEDLIRTAGQVRPKVAYLIPDFHNPTGHLLDDRGRVALAAALGRAGTVPIVDESMRWLAFDDVDLPPPFAAYAPDTVSVGSLSKPFWGGLRIGWIRHPEHLSQEFLEARLSLDLGAALLEQLVAVELLADPAQLLEYRRGQLRASRDAALTALSTFLPEWRVTPPSGGLMLWCELPGGSASELARITSVVGVEIAPGPSFAPEGGLDSFVRLTLSAPSEVLTEAIERIGEAWRRLGAQPARDVGEPRPARRGPTLVA